MNWLCGMVWLGALLCGTSAALAQPLRVCQAEPARYAYRMAVAQLALDHTQPAGAARTTLAPHGPGADPSQERCLALLRQRQVDLVYLPPTAELLAEFDALKIDLHHGMLGYRLLLIHRKNEAAFAKVQTLAQLRGFTAGFGRQWSDFRLFEPNRLPVVTASSAETLLSMLDAGRFDYFHRGLHEAWAELAQHADKPNLMVEPHLALVYRFPVYFMFNRADKALRQRFERGMALAQADGSLKALFLREFGAVVARAQLSKRTLISLDYPLPEGLPPVDSSLWLN